MRWLVLCAILLPACGSDDGDPFRHGVVKLEFRRGAGDANPYIPGVQVDVAMIYGECLLDYYTAHPEMRQDGVEGEPIFTEWHDRLCADASFQADCEVASIDQDLDIANPELRVLYSMNGNLENRILRVGPFPTEETAACANGQRATVRVGRVAGLDDMGEVVWTMESFDPDDAVVDQGKAISIYGAD